MELLKSVIAVSIPIASILLLFWSFLGGASYVTEDYRSNGGIAFRANLKLFWVGITIITTFLFFPTLFFLSALFHYGNRNKDGKLNKKFKFFWKD